LNICPCCGARTVGDLSAGCAACGARAVGPPLARPERELPSYGRAFWLAASGAVLALAFAASVVAALLRRETFTFGLEALARAAESAAWRLKLTALPLSLVASAVGLKLFARVRREPARFAGRRVAAAGLVATLSVATLLAAFVAVSVPERLRRRELARQAGQRALLYATEQALARYRARFGTYPASLDDLQRLDDHNCEHWNLVAALGASRYSPETDIASMTNDGAKARGRRRGARVRTAASRSTDDLTGPGIALTNYELTLPGPDGLVGTADDMRLRDGRILDGPRPASAATPSANATPRAR
jgi:type II secretory pathway pseudopilin PulG